MKKVLLLGGSHFQVPSVQEAKKLGYYTITCDYLPDNPGHKFADEYHNVSTTDKEAVLQLAQTLNIDGIVCYASDPAAPTAAYVAEKMGLPGQPYKSVEILSNKDLFRAFLTQNGFNVPRARGFTTVQDALNDWDNFKKPVMVKPVDSSGSKGVSKINERADLEAAITNALSFSRCKRFIIEEFIEAAVPQVSGDGISIDGKLVFSNFGAQFFETNAANPFTPVANVWPHPMPQRLHQKVHNELQRALDLLHMKTSAYNFEARIDKDENVYIIEIGPRNGGNHMPQIIQYVTDVNMVAYTIKAAMGEDCSDLVYTPAKRCGGYYVIHADKSGVFDHIDIDETFRKEHIITCDIMKNPGDEVSAFSGSNATVGILLCRYDSPAQAAEIIKQMSQFVKVVVK